MMGTLAAALAKKGVRTHEEVYRAEVSGDIEEVDGVLKITRIDVVYSLNVADERKEDAKRAFDAYLADCPAAQSVIGCIKIGHQLNFT